MLTHLPLMKKDWSLQKNPVFIGWRKKTTSLCNIYTKRQQNFVPRNIT